MTWKLVKINRNDTNNLYEKRQFRAQKNFCDKREVKSIHSKECDNILVPSIEGRHKRLIFKHKF